ncbi:PIN domain-containing protein [Nonomuraea sp. NPDC050153]|uniref:PIN domain-containing protein n=1 Tax=Nonomuraea sp. NPDC050153 TaxID=3364359 RepID=UPI0037B91A78
MPRSKQVSRPWLTRCVERDTRQLRVDYLGRIAAVGEREASAYLAIHKTLKSAGMSIDPPDALIGATAMANGWTLATRNVKHMDRTGALVVNPWEGPA